MWGSHSASQLQTHWEFGYPHPAENKPTPALQKTSSVSAMQKSEICEGCNQHLASLRLFCVLGWSVIMTLHLNLKNKGLMSKSSQSSQHPKHHKKCPRFIWMDRVHPPGTSGGHLFWIHLVPWHLQWYPPCGEINQHNSVYYIIFHSFYCVFALFTKALLQWTHMQ